MFVNFHGSRKAAVKMTQKHTAIQCKKPISENILGKNKFKEKTQVNILSLSDLETVEAVEQRSLGSNELRILFL